MNKVTLILLLIVLASCKSKIEKTPIVKDNKSEVKCDTTSEVTGTIIPSQEERIPPTQDDINQFINTRGGEEDYWLLMRKFENTDNSFERLLLAIIAANKFKITLGYKDLTWVISDLLSKPDVGKHTMELVIYFHKIIGIDESEKRIIDHLNKMERKGEPVFTNGLDDYKLFCPTRLLRKLKLSVIRGDCKSYDILKQKMIDRNEEDYLLYYAYIMADRYGYQPAKQDVPLIIQHAFDKYGLGEIDPDTQYFIDTVTNTTE